MITIVKGITIGLVWAIVGTKCADRHASIAENPKKHLKWYCIYTLPGCLLTIIIVGLLTAPKVVY